MTPSHHRTLLTASLLAMLLPASSVRGDDLCDWGAQTLAMIQRDFPKKPDLWAAGIELAALTAAAKSDPKYLPQAQQYAIAIFTHHGRIDHLEDGLAAPANAPKAARYFDDNEWIVLDLLELYDLSHDPKNLSEARELFRFVLSGEDNAMGGGIWWREQRDTKNTCSNAPAIVAALELYQATHDAKYIATARQLYDWVNAHFLDADGLYFDHLEPNGSIDKTKWSYNTALMIRANLLLAAILHEPRYLAEAQRLGHAAVAHWVQNNGAIADSAPFAELLCGALLKLYAADHDANWRQVVVRALIVLHQKGRDPAGHYPSRWEQSPDKPLPSPAFIAQASAARAYWEACGVSVSPTNTQSE